MNVVDTIEIIGLATIVAANPVPVVSLLALLTRPSGPRVAPFFVAGWMGATLTLVTALSLGGFALPSIAGSVSPQVSGVVLPIILGIAMVLLGMVLMLRRPTPPDAPPSRLGRAFTELTPARAVLLGAGLSIIKPKALIAVVAASAIISSEGRIVGGAVLLIGVFVVVASSTVAAPVALQFFGGDRAAVMLQRVHIFVTRYFSRSMGILFLALGVTLAAFAISRLIVRQTRLN